MNFTREFIDIGENANDGTGDTLRAGAQKMDRNFGRLFFWAGGDSDLLSTRISFDSDTIVFEGNVFDGNETRLKANNPTSDRTVCLPDASGDMVLTDGEQTLNEKTLTTPVLIQPKINSADSDYAYTFTPVGALTADRNISIPVLSSNDALILSIATQNLQNKNISNSTLTSVNVATALNDENGAGMLTLNSTASAVVNVELSNAATGNSPALSAVGADSDVTLDIVSKGTGAVNISKGAYSVSTMTASGTASEANSFIDINSGTPIAITVADGTVNGEFKILANRGTGLATITPTNFANGTSFAMAQNNGCEIIWNGVNWFLIGNQSAVTVS